MTIVLSVSNFINREKLKVKTNDVFLLSGLLWLDDDGARLYNWEDDQSIILNDPEACSILRSHFSYEYLGGVILQAWVKDGNEGLEIYNVYWFASCEPNHNPCAPSKLGAKIIIRPVPEQYQYCREPF
ncbi:hypothetical protein [Pseudanabaena sp. BC1403]|uniref:hypothetical protein n=1 Tax=Pseudanabaena sp. BC1403 TaxID=2043171 RepID=UPI000CD7FC31|nr:hypothetical protein [Pseudanabaena sp. BC1403]